MKTIFDEFFRNTSKRSWFFISFAIANVLFSGCQEEKKTQIKNKAQVTAVESTQWNRLFLKNSGWFGGDGIFGIPLDGKEFVPATDSTVTLFTFGDTMIGEHDGDTLLKEDFHMINNSVGILKGKKPDPNQITFHWKTTEDNTSLSLFKPETPNSKPDAYYWLGDGFVNTEVDSTLYIFAYPIQVKDTTGIGGFGFEQIGVNLLAIPAGSQPPFTNHKQIETPFFDAEKQTSFGSAIYVNTKSAGAPNPDGFIYIYAVSNQDRVKGLMVARVLPKDFAVFGKWRFWDGDTWVSEMTKASFIAENVSNEMSVSPLSDGRILLTYQYFTMSPEVTIQLGKSLVGPFEERKTIYQTSENKENKSYFTYNAKAYPHLSSSDSLLVSYNVNSLDFFSDILGDPNLYRPRFLSVALDN